MGKIAPNISARSSIIRWPVLGWAIAIVIAIGAIYFPAISHPFVFDDGLTVLINPQLRQIFNPPGLGPDQMQTGLEGRPVLRIGFAINYAICGTDPAGYRAVNIIIHLINAMLLFAILRELLKMHWPKAAASDVSIHIAGAIALLWAVHPINTESVTYITQRSESQMALFMLLTIFAVIQSRVSGHPAIWAWIGFIACALGMGSKEEMVGTPIIALVMDWLLFPAPGDRERRVIRRRLIIGLFLCWVILPVELQQADLTSKAGYGSHYITHWDNLKTQAAVITHYLRLCFIPRNLEIDYFDWPVARSLLSVFPQCLLVVGLLALSIYACIKRHWSGLCGAWFFLMLAPTSSFIPMFTEIAAERRMYLPSAAVIAIVVISLIKALSALCNRSANKGAIMALTAVLAIPLGLLAAVRNYEYSSEVMIWQRAVEVRPNNERAVAHLAEAYMRRKPPDFIRARQLIDQALTYRPRLVFATELDKELREKEGR